MPFSTNYKRYLVIAIFN